MKNPFMIKNKKNIKISNNFIIRKQKKTKHYLPKKILMKIKKANEKNGINFDKELIRIQKSSIRRKKSVDLVRNMFNKINQ